VTEAGDGDQRLTVLYDARCRICTRIAGRMAGADRGRRLRLRPLQQAHEDDWASVRQLRAERDLRAALHVVDRDGKWAAGGEAFLQALESVPCFAPLARLSRARPLSVLVDPGYRWFARHRARFAFMAGSFGAAQGVRRR
jgi:predicted DCC family thiol-disulfide oxidoreductase YuxK